MNQILIIHGGDAFDPNVDYHQQLLDRRIDYERLKPRTGWKTWLAQQLPADDVLVPDMPDSDKARYKEWQIVFEKVLPFLESDVIFVGHSLGASFLVKYLSENILPKKAQKTILVASPLRDESIEGLGDFIAPAKLDLHKNTDELHFFHSSDDPVVPFSEFLAYQRELPNAAFHQLDNRLHFNDTTFPELLELIKQK